MRGEGLGQRQGRETKRGARDRVIDGDEKDDARGEGLGQRRGRETTRGPRDRVIDGSERRREGRGTGSKTGKGQGRPKSR